MDWYHLYFQDRGLSVNFCHGDVSVDAPVKGTIFMLTTQMLTICNGRTCNVVVILYSAAHHMSNFITQST